MAATFVAYRWIYSATEITLEVDVDHLSTDTTAAVRAAADARVATTQGKIKTPIAYVSTRAAHTSWTVGTTAWRRSTITYRRNINPLA